MKKFLSYITLVSLIIISSCNKEEINELEKRNEDLIAQTANLQKQINDLSLDVSNLSSSNDLLSSSNNDLSNQITVLQNKINELELALNNMTNEYDEAIDENDDLYDQYVSLINSKIELQVQLDNLISEINIISCPPIELASPSMKSEQLFCTYQNINTIVFGFDESLYSLSFIQDSIPTGIYVVKTPGKVEIIGSPISNLKDIYSFDLKFTSDQCEKVKRIVLARNPNSAVLSSVSGAFVQSIVSGAQIEPIEISFGGSSEGLSFSNLPEGLTYSIDGNKYKLEGTISEAGSYSFSVSTVNTSGCGEIHETISFEVEGAPVSTSTGNPTGSGGCTVNCESSGSTGSGGTTTQYLLTVNTGANGSVSSTGGSYDDGQSLSVTASPDSGYSFVNWTDSSGNELSTNTTYTFNISNNTTITANYQEALFYLHPNGVTILCPNAAVGAIGSVNGVQYEKVNYDRLKELRNQASGGNNPQLEFVCTSGVIFMKDLFRNKRVFNTDISSWDTSDVENMERLFAEANAFNQDISKWDVGKVRFMEKLLKGAHAFNQNIGGWDTGEAENMREMIRMTREFNQDISGWDVRNVKDMRGFAKQTWVFNQDLSGWNVEGVNRCDGFDNQSLAMDPLNRPNFTNCNPNIVDSNPIPN